MKIHAAPLATRQDQDLAVRLRYAAQRRASDKARRETLEHTRWIAPDAVFHLRAVLTNEARRLETGVPVEESRTHAREGPGHNTRSTNSKRASREGAL